MRPAQPNQSLIDGLACLQALASSPTAIGTRQMARDLGLEPTRVNRLLKTLAHIGLAEQDERRAYRPGPGIHVLAAQSLVGSTLLRHAIEPLEDLRKHGHIVALAVLWHTETCYLYHSNPRDLASGALGHERLYPATSSGIGMALLAKRSDEEIRELYSDDGKFPSQTDPCSPRSVEELAERIERVRTNGWALVKIPDSPFRTLGIVIDEKAQAGIGLSGSFSDDEVPTLLEALHRAAERITRH